MTRFAHAGDAATRASRESSAEEAVRGLPRLSRFHLARPRITRILDENWPVVLLHAPGGYGKTSTLVEWARARIRPGLVWVSIDEQVSRTQFWNSVRDALVRGGLVDLDSPGLPASGLPEDPNSLRPAMLSLIEASRIPLDLVVDSAQASLPDGLDQDLIHVLQRSDRARLRLASRSSSLLNDLSTAVRLDRRVVDLRELRFTLAEVHHLAAFASVHASNTHVEQLHRASDGWPLAIRTALQLGPRSVGSTRAPWFHDAPFGEGMTYVRKLLLDEVMDVPGFRQFIPTAVLDVFTIDQAAALGADPVGGVLDDLEARGLGAWEADAPEPRFRLLPLLREALLEAIPRTELLDTHARMAAWWAERDVARAVDSAIRAERWSLASRLARRDFAAVAASLAQDHQALATVPRSVLRTEPVLSVLSGLGHYIAGDIPRAMRTLALAVAVGEQTHAPRTEPTTVDQVWTQGLASIALRLLGRWEAVSPALRAFERLLVRVDDPDGDLVAAMPIIVNQIAFTHFLLDRLGVARAALSHHRSSHAGESASRHRVNSDSLDALIDSVDGDIDSARRKVGALSARDSQGSASRGAQNVALTIAQAIVRLEELDASSARRQLDETRPTWTSIELWPMIARARAQAEWMLAGPEPALALLTELRAEKRSRPAISTAMTAMLDSIAAELLLALGRGAEARALTSARRRRVHPRLAIPAARDFLIAGEPELALGLADRTTRQSESPRVQLDALTIAAAAANRVKEVETARERFRAAVDLARRTGLQLSFFAMPRDDFLALSESHFVPAPLRERVLAGRPAFPTPGHSVRLTPREQVVVEELATGAPIPQVARRLNVSANTVKAQIRSISKKLSASGRAEIVAAARRHRVL